MLSILHVYLLDEVYVIKHNDILFMRPQRKFRKKLF